MYRFSFGIRSLLSLAQLYALRFQGAALTARNRTFSLCCDSGELALDNTLLDA